MYRVRKVYAGSACGQIEHFSLRSKHENLVDVEVELKHIQIFAGVADVVLQLHYASYPRKFIVVYRRISVRNALFVFPVRGDTVFSYTVHFVSSYLYLER